MKRQRLLTTGDRALLAAIRALGGGTRRERIHADSPRTREVSTGFDPIIEYRYQWRGASYRSRAFSPALRTIAPGEAETFDRTYAVGTRHQCRLDPDQPERAFIAW